MGLHVVIHRPQDGPAPDAAACRTALREAVWQVAESHWDVTQDVVLVRCDLSPDYLLGHFRRALARAGFPDPGALAVLAAGPRGAWTGLGAEAEAWMRAALEP